MLTLSFNARNHFKNESVSKLIITNTILANTFPESTFKCYFKTESRNLQDELKRSSQKTSFFGNMAGNSEKSQIFFNRISLDKHQDLRDYCSSDFLETPRTQEFANLEGIGKSYENFGKTSWQEF